MRIFISVLLALCCIAPAFADEDAAAVKAMIQQGSDLFFAANIPASIAAFNAVAEKYPAQVPHLWQRGIAYYYTGDHAAGRKQFELHRTVNEDDVENAVWHFLCIARSSSVAAARAALIPVTGDDRVPMKEIYALYAGAGTVSNVIAAASDTSADEKDQRRRLNYAHLYIGLYYEALGNNDQAKYYLLKAANEYSMPHYMGRTAKLHVKLRGW